MNLFIWTAYHLIIATFIIIDLLVGRKRQHGLTFREAALHSALWVGVGVAFGAIILVYLGSDAAVKYYGVFVLEKTLSMDNLFVFLMIFTYFAVPPQAQPFVLYIGVISAIILRAAFIYGGILLLEAFHWMVFPFGAILIYSGIRIWEGMVERTRVERNPFVRWAKKVLPMADHYQGTKFLIRTGNDLMFTPLILVLVAIESSDLMFAIDSVPAAIALVQDLSPSDLKFFVAYTGNISAILGLRALYFLIALTVFRFVYIGKGLAFILVYLGAKFFLSGIDIKIPGSFSIALVFGALAVAIIASILVRGKNPAPPTE